tara:strand:+ start:286 stop:519 length:234 start_codon:yes stop_codon:yes gene_type:complete
MDTNKWKSVAIRREIVQIAEKIGEITERPTSNVFAFAVKRLQNDLDSLQKKSTVKEECEFELEKIPSDLERKKNLLF